MDINSNVLKKRSSYVGPWATTEGGRRLIRDTYVSPAWEPSGRWRSHIARTLRAVRSATFDVFVLTLGSTMIGFSFASFAITFSFSEQAKGARMIGVGVGVAGIALFAGGILGAYVKRKHRHRLLDEVAHALMFSRVPNATQLLSALKGERFEATPRFEGGREQNTTHQHRADQVAAFVLGSVVLMCAASLPVWYVFGIVFINPLLAIMGIVAAVVYAAMLLVGSDAGGASNPEQ